MSGRGFIAVEPPDICEWCGTYAELRPYGPSGERLCHTCADEVPEEIVHQRMAEYLGTKDDDEPTGLANDGLAVRKGAALSLPRACKFCGLGTPTGRWRGGPPVCMPCSVFLDDVAARVTGVGAITAETSAFASVVPPSDQQLAQALTWILGLGDSRS